MAQALRYKPKGRGDQVTMIFRSLNPPGRPTAMGSTVVSRGGRIVDVVLEWKWESNLGLRLGGEGLLTPINNSFVEHRVYWEWI